MSMPKAAPPKTYADPGLAPTIDPDTPTRRKWAKVQLARDRELMKRGFWFDAALADHVQTFLEKFCRHSKGKWAGTPITLEPWQVRMIRRLFGWRAPDGARRYRKCHFKVARKNGKSILAAGIALYLVCGDGEPGADVFGAAVDREQARLVHREAINMVKKSPELRSRLQTFTDVIIMPATLSAYKPLSKDGQNKDGLNIHGLIRDELHEWTDREFETKLRTAMGSRTQPLTFDATTAGDDPNSIWGQEDEYAHQVADGRVGDATYLPVLYEAEASDNWKDEKTWAKANPNLGVSVFVERLRETFLEACNKPGVQLEFLRYHLNLTTQKVGRWMNMRAWDACGRLKVHPDALKGKPCWVGLDLSRRTDFTAAVALFKVEDLLVPLCQFWIPESKIDEKQRSDKIAIRDWIDRGLVDATPGDVIDYAHARAQLNRWAKEYQLEEIAYDPAGATQLVLQLQDEDGLTCVEHKQTGMVMGEPTKVLEAAVLQKRLAHAGNPVLRWMASNCVAHYDANDNVKLLKNRSAGRIDGVIALIMAVSRATLAQEFKSVYETRGVETF